MHQLEINFFWPLTEQVPLELDYSNCEKPKFVSPPWASIDLYNDTGYFTCANGPYVLTNDATSTYALHVDGKVYMDADKITFRTSKKLNTIRKMLFSIMGIKLENA